MSGAVVVVLLAATPISIVLSLFVFRVCLVLLGRSLRSRTKAQRDLIYKQYRQEEKAIEDKKPGTSGKSAHDGKDSTTDSVKSSEWAGIVGFFHPFCNAGGGGERVLWAAIAATQKKYPRAICAVYTGDHELERSAIIEKVYKTFEITLHEPTLHFIYLSQRHFVLASTFPHFTLLGQSLGSLVLVLEAFTLLVPDIFIDSMGYAFAVGLCHFLFPWMPTAAYVHYPTISTDMLTSLDDTTGVKGIHAGRGTGWRGRAKRVYWQAFAWAYGWVGQRIDVVMCNSSWTAGHITQLWDRTAKLSKATVVYPPCPVTQVARKVDISAEGEKKRKNVFLYVAQFRPEKNHFLILNAFAKYYHSLPKSDRPPHLVLIGSVRVHTPDEKHIYRLRLEARNLHIDSATTFITDAPFETIMKHLAEASVGLNGMYSEHFGIGNVEGQAAGLILVCHNSGGPKLDICLPLDGQPTGFLAETDEEYADAFRRVSGMTDAQRFAMRSRARKSAHRFTDEIFAHKWTDQLDRLVELWGRRNKRKVN